MIIDSQPVKTAEGGHHRSYDAGKMTTGRKRFVAVDVEGNLLGVLVTGADVGDNIGGIALLEKLAEQSPSVRVVWCDQAFKRAFVEHAERLSLQVVVISRQPGSTGFSVLPRRGVVERFFAWISRARRLARDYERTVSSAVADGADRLLADDAATTHPTALKLVSKGSGTSTDRSLTCSSSIPAPDGSVGRCQPPTVSKCIVIDGTARSPFRPCGTGAGWLLRLRNVGHRGLDAGAQFLGGGGVGAGVADGYGSGGCGRDAQVAQ